MVGVNNTNAGGGSGSSRLKQFFSTKRESPVFGSTGNSRRSSLDLPPHINNLLNGMSLDTLLDLCHAYDSDDIVHHCDSSNLRGSITIGIHLCNIYPRLISLRICGYEHVPRM